MDFLGIGPEMQINSIEKTEEEVESSLRNVVLIKKESNSKLLL
jgi:hypothetical protein